MYGWSVALQRAVAEFATLQVTAPDRFTVTGSGLATVSTPPAFARNASFTVTAGSVTTLVRSDKSGRLQLRIDLGPSHSAQQYTPAAQAQQSAAGAAYFRSVTVTIAPLRGR